MNATDIFGVFTGGLGVLGFLWSLAQWLSPYTRFSALQRTVQRLEYLVEEVEDRGVRLDIGVMREIWARYHRCNPYYLLAYEINSPSLVRIHEEYHHLRVHTLIQSSFLHTAKLVVARVPQKITRLDRDAHTLHDDIRVRVVLYP
jgi:predicted alpha/beta hydrolase